MNYFRIHLTNGDNFDIYLPFTERLGDKYHQYLQGYHYEKYYQDDSDWYSNPEDAWEADNPLYVIDWIEILPKCFGCRWDCPAQKDHMDTGGCLYQGSEED